MSAEPAAFSRMTDYSIDVIHAASDEIRVRFTPQGEAARYLKDGTVEYVLRRGETSKLVEPTG